MIYFTADMHLGHRAIITMQNRPFESVEEMDRVLIQNYNSVVNRDDTVYILGDICHHMKVEEADGIIKKLTGKKYLIKGNHDKNYDPRLFMDMQDFMKISVDGNHYALMHYPMMSWPKKNSGGYQLHGHIHSRMDYNESNRAEGIRRYDVGVDANNFFPVSVKQIEKLFEDTKPVVMTRQINTFDGTPRKIRCIEKTHVFIGDGHFITEEELEVGKEYTFVPHGGRHDGLFIHILEHPKSFGYPAYLFEELVPYDEQIGIKATWENLEKSLEKAEQDIREGRVYSDEEVRKHIEEGVEEMRKERNPERIPGYIDLLTKAWDKHPDMRLGQLIQYSLGETDLWDIKDKKIFEALRQLDRSI